VDTARERIQRLEDAVHELAVSGQLPLVRTFRLVFRLEKAIAALDAGRTQAAVRRLQRFALRVGHLGARRELVLGDALVLARAADRVRKDIGGGG
jgi:hypothetical protein